MPMAPQECIDIPGAEAVDSLDHLTLEGKPPHFAVGHDVEPRCLLEGDRLIDGPVLYGLELGVTETPGLPLAPRFAQRDRPKKTANNISMCRNHCRFRQLNRTSALSALEMSTIILLEICAAHEPAFGTKRTFRGSVLMSAFGGKPDMEGSELLLCKLDP